MSNHIHCCDMIFSIKPVLPVASVDLKHARFPYLSRAQQVISLGLFESLADVKIFDRLQPLGICTCYAKCNKVVEFIGHHFNEELIECLKNGKRFRIAGDNIDWTVKVGEQRLKHRNRMFHAFGSMAVVQNVSFDSVSDVSPQRQFFNTHPKEYLLSMEEWGHVRQEYGIWIAEVARNSIPALEVILKDNVTDLKAGDYADQLSSKNKVIPLPVLFKNEQSLSDVTDILSCYEDILEKCCIEAGIDTVPKVHIGGDQLTRERFSSAKCLRIGHNTAKSRFEHLSPITFEFFHMLMNYLMMFFKQLCKDSVSELGTMKCEILRIGRSNVDEDVRKAYAQDKDFVLSYVNSYITEAVLHHFGMADAQSSITKNVPPEDESLLKEWVQSQLNYITDNYVVPKMEHYVTLWQGESCENVIEDGIVANESNEPVAQQEDGVKNYAHRVLEMGLLLKSLLHLMKNPDRTRGLRLLKLAMATFKSHNNRSKYALEILRLLVHQTTSMSLKDAHEQFYGMFVNTKGLRSSFVPVDEQMEWLVGFTKKHIKHAFSNKTEANIIKKSSAFPGVSLITNNYDLKSNVIIRSKKHKKHASGEDEMQMVDDLRKVRPFDKLIGRQHSSFSGITTSVIKEERVPHLLQWIQTRSYLFATEFGN